MTATRGLQVNDSATIRVALGEVYFRQGKIPEAEKEWIAVINSGYPAARAYLGLARARWAIAMNKSAKAMIDKAHELGPSDPDIQRICDTFTGFEESQQSKIFPNAAFGYWKVTVERPLRLKVDLGEERRLGFREFCVAEDEEPIANVVDTLL